MDAFSIAISIALQYGVPLEAFVSKFVNMKFEPAGLTDDPDVRMSQSIMDYVFRRLALDYLPEEKRAEFGIYTAEERAAIYEDRVGELEKLRETDRAAYDAERVTLIRELEGIRATVLMLQEPEKVVRELPAVSTTMDNADPPGFLRRLFGGGSSPSQ
jgi:ribonucleoside-diphosphate reductase alpha chain